MRQPPRSAALAAVLAAAVCAAAPAPAATAKGLVGLSVCGAHGCVDRTALLPKGGGDQEGGLLDAGVAVADPGRARFVRLKLHLGDPVTRQRFGVSTMIYLTTSGLVRAGDGTWHRPGPQAATLFKRAARHVAPVPGARLRPFEPSGPPIPESPWVPAPAHRAAAAGDRVPAGLVAGAAAAVALALAGGAALARTRRGRPATG